MPSRRRRQLIAARAQETALVRLLTNRGEDLTLSHDAVFGSLRRTANARRAGCTVIEDRVWRARAIVRHRARTGDRNTHVTADDLAGRTVSESVR